MRPFSRFFIISAAAGFLSSGGLLALAQTSGTELLPEISTNELGDVVSLPPPPPTSDGTTILPALPPPPITIDTPIQPPPAPLTRPVLVETSQSSVARGILEIVLFVDGAENIEIFAGKLSGGEGRMVGSATRTASDPRRWVFHWDSTQHENGLYGIGARIRTGEGYFWSRIAEITVLNTVSPPPSVLTNTPSPTPSSQPPPPPVRIEKKTPPPPPELVRQIPALTLTNTEEEAIKRRIRDDISKLSTQIEVLDNRPKDLVGLTDSDNDGITDYDEKNIYQTNPNLKDSDKDGISDGVELLSNQDPSNATVNSISYQSPKDSGTPRPEILAVTDIQPVLTTAPDGTMVLDKITLTGQAPPHSVVTLYIFSTPYVVTAKTNAEGKWTYTFDKELSDGDHEVYVTITDSKGSVIVKSASVPFIKTANAISKTPPPTGPIRAKPSIYGTHPTSFIIAFITSIIGIACIVVGLVVRRRRSDSVLSSQ